MRIRTIKPTFWKSETMASIPKDARLLAVALLNYADDEGYFMANDALIRGECFPFDEDSKSIRRGLQELSKIGYIALGTTSHGQKIGHVSNFLEHQRIDKSSPSKIKQKQVTWDDSTSPPRVLPESSPTEVGREVGSGSRKGSEVAPERFAEFWTKYPGPRKIAKVKCLAVWASQNLEPLADRILSHVALMAVSAQWMEQGGHFIPAPLTYLNQRRWEDGAPVAADTRRLAV